MDIYRNPSTPMSYIENDTDLYHLKPGKTDIELILGPLEEFLEKIIMCYKKLFGKTDERFLLLEKESLLSSIRTHIKELDNQRKNSMKYCISCHSPINCSKQE